MDKDVFVPFRPCGSVAVSEGCCGQPITILMVTALAQSLLLWDACPGVEQCFTGEFVLVKGIGGVLKIPLDRVYLNSSLVFGVVVVGVTLIFVRK